MPAAEGPASRLEPGPLFAWISVLASALIALVLLASVWTTGSVPGGIPAWAAPVAGALLLVVAFVAPAGLVLGVAIVAARYLGSSRLAPPGWIGTPREAAVQEPVPNRRLG